MAAWLGGDIDEALDQVHVPAHLIDRGGRVRWQNARSIALFGDVRGRYFTEMLAPEARMAARVECTKKVLGSVRTTHFETVLLRTTGARVPSDIHSVVVEDGEQVVGIFSIVEVAASPADPTPLRSELTPRQLEVLRALARGSSTAQIAEASSLSPETVRKHVRGVLRVLRVHSRLAAVAEARRRGLID